MYAGKVGTGYDEQTLTGLRKRLDALERGDQPFAGEDVRERGVHWVRPELVAEKEEIRGRRVRHSAFQPGQGPLSR
ncbi:hypothetical protein [Streptomyces sp. OE57]|uniref:ATP dependent DNA ligase n=1 Tax=Streptomyces lacaronensis TaxID=3379885 RepID=UPI0039B72942